MNLGNPPRGAQRGDTVTHSRLFSHPPPPRCPASILPAPSTQMPTARAPPATTNQRSKINARSVSLKSKGGGGGERGEKAPHTSCTNARSQGPHCPAGILPPPPARKRKFGRPRGVEMGRRGKEGGRAECAFKKHLKVLGGPSCETGVRALKGLAGDDF